MFGTGQIVFDYDLNAPAIAYVDFGKRKLRQTHFIHNLSEGGKVVYALYLPSTIEEAKTLLQEGRISPSPLPYTHCTKCFNWTTNHNKDGSCFVWK